MADINGHTSSDDELFVDGAFADPGPYTFQSDLSDDDDDDTPDLLPLDKIATASLAALNGSLAGLVSPPEVEPGDEPMDEEDEPRPATRRKHTSRARTNGSAETPAHKPGNGFTPVKIEVRLPWLSPAQRAQHRRVEVEDFRPEDGNHRRLRRKRHAVSRFPCVASLGFWVCLGYGACDVGLEVGVWGFSAMEARSVHLSSDDSAPQNVDGKPSFKKHSPAEPALLSHALFQRRNSASSLPFSLPHALHRFHRFFSLSTHNISQFQTFTHLPPEQ